jgi:DNA helicase-2/ATP-dependent DNA helicase PcrA
MTPKTTTPRGAAKILQNLNDVQQEAVLQTDNPILVLAGAGSGKTRVLTHKIAYLVDVHKIKPWNILAMTFTNKAAGEMKERIRNLTANTSDSFWMGTFHSIFARILRREGERIGYNSNFTIYDTDDQRQVIKTIMERLKIPLKNLTPRAAQSQISRAKNDLITPRQLAERAQSFFEENIAKIYEPYQRVLKEQNAMDFDDLLWKPIELFTACPDLLAQYQSRFQYILVDEYQDTNRAQYILIKMLSEKNRNICVVGDDDQSIYHWRGADVRNILDFENDFPDCRIFRLEQNYRSTKNILAAANCVVRNNANRLEKTLWTNKGEGEKLTLLTSGTAFLESDKIVEKIQYELGTHKRNFRDFAILYRTNAQSRILEESLRNATIAYIIVGGTRFYERKEVKDVLAYLRLVVNSWDTISAKRIINYPIRGIGESTVQKIDEFAYQQRISFYEALGRVHEIEGIDDGKKARIYNFYQLIEKYSGLQEKITVSELVRTLVDDIGILPLFKTEGSVEAMSRYDNVIELLSAITDFSKRNESPRLAAFLEEVSLLTDIDTWEDRSNAVTLMTLHAAKGLEFPVVVLAGLEEGLFPLSRNMESDQQLEEERRLFYVGATRAQEKLYLSWAQQRGYGENLSRGVKSRFIGEIDNEFIEREIKPQRTEPGRRNFRNQEREGLSYEYDSEGFSDDSPQSARLEPGMRVRHSNFGEGTIQQVDGYNENMKVTVAFKLAGIKRLMVKYANLEII